MQLGTSFATWQLHLGTALATRELQPGTGCATWQRFLLCKYLRGSRAELTHHLAAELKHRAHLSKVFYSTVQAAQLSKKFLITDKRVAKRPRVEDRAELSR